MEETRQFNIVWLKVLGVKLYSYTSVFGGGGSIDTHFTKGDYQYVEGKISSISSSSSTYQQVHCSYKANPAKQEMLTFGIDEFPVAEGQEIAQVFENTGDGPLLIGVLNKSTNRYMASACKLADLRSSTTKCEPANDKPECHERDHWGWLGFISIVLFFVGIFLPGSLKLIVPGFAGVLLFFVIKGCRQAAFHTAASRNQAIAAKWDRKILLEDRARNNVLKHGLQTGSDVVELHSDNTLTSRTCDIPLSELPAR